MARRIGSGDTWKVAGLYEAERQRVSRDAAVDPRALFVTDDPAEREALSATSPNVIAARRKLAAMDRGEPVECLRPSLRPFPSARTVPWLADLMPGVSRVIRVTVWPDDTVRPAAYG
jgi:hypothetical protein